MDICVHDILYMSKNILHIHKYIYMGQIYITFYQILIGFIYDLTSYDSIFNVYNIHILHSRMGWQLTEIKYIF